MLLKHFQDFIIIVTFALGLSGCVPASEIEFQGADYQRNLISQAAEPESVLENGPLIVSQANPRYFENSNGEIVYLTGSHTWLNLQDGVLTTPPPAFDYTGWLDFLEAHNHNFFRLWAWEEAKWVVEWDEPYYFAPMPYQRTGPGLALDGEPKFDLTKLNQAYFDRLRERVIEAGDRGMYVSVMLFNGWSVASAKGSYDMANSWLGHPFHADNNINSINGDPNGDDSGIETHELAVPEITQLQELYVMKVIDTVNDLDNVLFEISNESHEDSQDWQYHMVNFIKDYESALPNQHPVGMTVEWPNGSNNDLFASSADWVSLNGDISNPELVDGTKVVILDTDHVCGICGDRAWVWKAFTQGHNPLFMDQYDDSYKLDGGGYDLNNPNDVSLRLNLGYTQSYASRMDLKTAVPQPNLASSGYALASEKEYLVYLPSGGSVRVDLTAVSGTFDVEWFNPQTGEVFTGATVPGSAMRNFVTPFTGDAVLYLCRKTTTGIPGTPTGALDEANYLPIVMNNTPNGSTCS